MFKIIKELNIGKNLYEYDLHRTDGVAYAFYFSDISSYIGQKVPLHWHREFEITLVKKGRIKIFLDNLETILEEGEGVFINSEVFHGYNKFENKNSEFLTVVFDSSFITGSESENHLFSKYIDPLISNSNLDFIKFSPNIDWHCRCLENINCLFNLNSSEPYYEFSIREFLTKTICLIHRNNSTHKIHDLCGMNFTVTKMTDFIRENYTEPISVIDIANSANISRRDCFRKFRDSMGITPIDYLDSVRIKAAVLLLSESDKTITEIGLDCGFESGSYFSTKFKKAIGISPAEYKKRQRSL